MKIREFTLFASLAGVVLLMTLLVTNSRPATAQGSGTTERVSVASDGSQGNQGSYWPSISADGRYIAFFSNASNLVNGDTNNWSDVFVHDRQTNQTIRVSVASNGAQGDHRSESPSISADGRYVAFECYSSNLVNGDTNQTTDVCVHDRQTGQTTRVSVASDGTQGNYFTRTPAISGNGGFVAFESWATTLVVGDTNNKPDIFVHDRQTSQTSRVSISSAGAQGNNSSEGPPSLSADGRYVVFHSSASNLVLNDTNSNRDVFVHDRQTDQTTRVSVNSDGSQINNWSTSPAISADGRYVGFVSLDGTIGGNVFIHDRQTGQTTLIAHWASGGLGNNYEPHISLSTDGRYVAYKTTSGQVYLYDQQTGQTTLISAAPDGTQGNGFSRQPSISADGRYVAFSSDATNLVNGDTNGYYDIFVRDRGSGPENTYSISGQILAYEDTLINGNLTQISHPLGYAVVTLMNHTKGTNITTVSSASGGYNATINANLGDSLSVRASLIYRRNNTDLLQMQYASIPAAPVVYIETQPFPATSATSVQQDLHFVATLPYIIPAGMSRYHLDDTALMYHHFQETLDFTLDILNVILDYQLPIEILAFDNGLAADSGGYVNDTASIRFGTSVSLATDPRRPMNREWHEYFHHLMQEALLHEYEE